jgi:DNA-binding transcriptional regulator YdaS (Cro superfamily)
MNTDHEQQAKKALELAIELAGGQRALARLCGGKVTQVHVRNWLHRNKKKALPCEYVLRVEKALNGKISRYEFRPDIYPLDEF